MKATILCGSADPEGVTDSMCRCADEYLRSNGCQVDLFRLGSMDIGHCRDCDGCTSGKCIIEDDMSALYDSYHGSDILILASPIHFSGPSSLIKAAMDRFQPMWHDKGSSHPLMCTALLCGGSEKPNFEYTERIIKAFCITCGMNYMGSAKISATDFVVSDVSAIISSHMQGIIPDKG
ncbi:MAG: flavodoxin family protein [Thermoplasmata archaeon]|nr:flavodoxin family protein [Thermoplasmata archaeon]